MNLFKKFIALGLILFALYGCASTAKVIDHASLKTKVTLSEPIFLNLATPERTVYVKVTNTSDIQNVSLEPVLKDRLIKKGLTLLDDPTKANWIVHANITSLFYEKLGSMGDDAGKVGAAVGGIAGALIPGSSRDSWLGAAAGAIVGNVAGAIAGSLVKVESYIGNVDVQIQERVAGGVKGKVKTEAKQGTSTTMTTEQEVVSDFQTYRARFTVEATRTNINLEEALAELTAKVADQIAGLF
ncbi:MAG TPA: complement resistance protein TraT [Syntrophorhabdaceae bacterium]|nr:complement resistance protein TraT [Syntrophorhabdaceae bacterium]